MVLEDVSGRRRTLADELVRIPMSADEQGFRLGRQRQWDRYTGNGDGQLPVRLYDPHRIRPVIPQRAAVHTDVPREHVRIDRDAGLLGFGPTTSPPVARTFTERLQHLGVRRKLQLLGNAPRLCVGAGIGECRLDAKVAEVLSLEALSHPQRFRVGQSGDMQPGLVVEPEAFYLE